jgi:putative transposase
MLRSYTRAINKQESFSGKLFREATKAECLNPESGITPSFIKLNGITTVIQSEPEEQYPQICFNYIHNNPVKAKLVKDATSWEFSSAKDYAELRQGTLINKEKAKEFVVI